MQPDQDPAALPFRVKNLERNVEHLQERLEDYSALKQTVRSLEGTVVKMGEELGSIRRALYTAALTVGGSAILLAISLILSSR